MDSPAETARPARPRVELLDRLRERLERADALSREMRQSLARADRGAIEAASSRLETLALEFKLLVAEYRRLPAASAAAREQPDLVRAREELERAATRLARSAAIGGGLLERLVGLSRKLIDTLQAASGEPYLPSGRTRDLAFEGLRLRERA